MKEYYDFLKEELENFSGKFDKYILYVPDFFKLLCKLTEEDLDQELKLKINSALAYFVIPNDVIPEDIYGPVGYVDDIYVCVVVLNQIKEKKGIEFIENNWEGEEDFKKVLEVSYKKSLTELEDKGLVNKVLEVASLK